MKNVENQQTVFVPTEGIECTNSIKRSSLTVEISLISLSSFSIYRYSVLNAMSWIRATERTDFFFNFNIFECLNQRFWITIRIRLLFHICTWHCDWRIQKTLIYCKKALKTKKIYVLRSAQNFPMTFVILH